MGKKNLGLIISAALLLVGASAVVLINCSSPKPQAPSHYWYYPIEKTIPLKVDFTLTKDHEGNWLYPGRIAASENFLYVLDYGHNNVLKFDDNGDYLGSSFSKYAGKLPDIIEGFDVDKERVIVTGKNYIYLKLEDKELRMRNLYGISEAVFHEDKIYTLGGKHDNEGKILSVFSHEFKFLKSFGIPAYEGYEFNSPVQFWSKIANYKDEVALVSIFLPTFSLNNADSGFSKLFKIKGANPQIDMAKRKSELEGFFEGTGGIAQMTFGVCFVNGSLYIALVQDKYLLIAEFVKGKLQEVYSLDRTIVDAMSVENGIGIEGVQVFTEPTFRIVVQTDKYDVCLLTLIKQ